MSTNITPQVHKTTESSSPSRQKFAARTSHSPHMPKTSIPLIAPPNGKQVLISDQHEIPGITTIRQPRSQNVLFFNVNPEDTTNTNVFRARLALSNNCIEVVDLITYGNSAKELEKIKELIKTKINQLKDSGAFPDIIILPHPSDKNERSKLIRDAILKSIHELRPTDHSLTLVSPESSSIVPANTFFSFAAELMQRKLKGMSLHSSQMSRTPFDKVTLMANRATYLEKSGSAATPGYTEPFVRASIKNGVLIESSNEILEINIQQYAAIYHKAVLESPHPDDDLAADALLVALKNNGVIVDNLLLTTGYAAYIPGATTISEKSAIRAKEVKNSADYLGINLVTIVPADNEEQGSHGYEQITLYKDFLTPKVEEYFENCLNAAKAAGKKLLVLRPHPEDMHPSHQEMISLTGPILLKLSKNLGVEIDILQYASPWAGKFNCWSYYDVEESIAATNIAQSYAAANLLKARVRGHVGGELLAGFGASPYLGTESADNAGLGRLAERYFVENI